MKNLGWKARVGVVLSAVWLCMVFLLSEDYRRASQVLGLGLLPLVLLWGIAWAVAGWRSQRPQADASAPGSTEWRHRLKSAGIVIACLVAGVASANWQFSLAKHEGPTPVAYWFGEWMVWGLLSYVAFRSIPRVPARLAPVFAALVVVGGVNFKAYEALSLEREFKVSLAKAAPLVSRIDGGEEVTDEEIRRAQVGVFEPLLLVKVAGTRDVLAIKRAHEQAIAALEPDKWLVPTALGASESRQLILNRLAQARQEVASYKVQMEAAAARLRLGITSLSAQMPGRTGEGVVKGFDGKAGFVAAFVRDYAEASNLMIDAATEIVTSLEQAPRSFVIVKGPPQNILFNDQAGLDAYRGQMAKVAAAGQKVEQAKLALANAGRRGNDELSDFLEKP